MPNKLKYFTALCAISSSMMSDKDNTKSSFLEDYHPIYEKKFSRRFFNKATESFFYHPFILFSAAYHYKIADIRKEYNIEPSATIMGDSGGFQVANNKAPKSFDFKTSFDWCEQNSDVYPILDYPIPSEHYSFETALKNSVKSADYIYNHRSLPNKKVLNVLQGEGSFNQTKRWYKALSKYKFDGWAVSSRTGFSVLAKNVYFLLNQGEFNTDERQLHLFGMGSVDEFVFLTVLQKIFNDMGLNVQVTCDTSTASINSSKGVSLLNDNHSIGRSSFYYKEKDIIKDLGFGFSESLGFEETLEAPFGSVFKWALCDCGVCDRVLYTEKRIEDVFSNNNQFYRFAVLHNIAVTVRRIDMVNYIGNKQEWSSLPTTVRNNIDFLKLGFQKTNINDAFEYFDGIV